MAADSPVNAAALPEGAKNNGRDYAKETEHSGAGGKRRTIMIVDDNQADLSTAKDMLMSSYQVYALPSVNRLFKFLENVTPDLIFLNIAMPDMKSPDVITKLKANAAYANIPVILVAAENGESHAHEWLALGAVDYMAKPFSADILRKRIEKYIAPTAA